MVYRFGGGHTTEKVSPPSPFQVCRRTFRVLRAMQKFNCPSWATVETWTSNNTLYDSLKPVWRHKTCSRLLSLGSSQHSHIYFFQFSNLLSQDDYLFALKVHFLWQTDLLLDKPACWKMTLKAKLLTMFKSDSWTSVRKWRLGIETPLFTLNQNDGPKTLPSSDKDIDQCYLLDVILWVFFTVVIFPAWIKILMYWHVLSRLSVWFRRALAELPLRSLSRPRNKWRTVIT